MNLSTMKPDGIKELIRTITSKIKKGYAPASIILFGSYAHGKPNEHSDVDILVIKEDIRRPIDRAVGVLKLVEEENFRVPLDILVYTPKEVAKAEASGNVIIKEALSKGIVLYERSRDRKRVV